MKLRKKENKGWDIDTIFDLDTCKDVKYNHLYLSVFSTSKKIVFILIPNTIISKKNVSLSYQK